MTKLYELEATDEERALLLFHCPGCKYDHWVATTGDRPRWTFNGDFDKPTFSPSILVNQSHPSKRCHSFVKEGKIQFLSDCWHDLKGQTVDLPDLDENHDPIPLPLPPH